MSTTQQIDFLLAGVIGNSNSPNYDGLPLSGGKVYFRTPGTVALQTVWIDSAKGTVSANPVLLDAEGRAEIYAEGNYDIKIEDADGNRLETISSINYESSVVNSMTIKNVSADTTIVLGNQIILVDSSAGARVQTLPSSAAIQGQVIVIIRNGGNSVTVNAAAGEKISGMSSVVLSLDGQAMTFYAIAGGWSTTELIIPSGLAGMRQNAVNIFLNNVRDQSQEALTVLAMEEGFTDDYQSPNAQGADEAASTGFTYDNVNKAYKNTTSTAMTLKTRVFTTLSVPAKMSLFTIEDRTTGVPTYKVGRDGGTTMKSMTMTLAGTDSGNRKIYTAVVDMTTLPTGTSIIAQIDTLSTDDIAVHAIGLFSRQ